MPMPIDSPSTGGATAAQVGRDLFQQMARRDPAAAALYVTRMREEIASMQQVEAVVKLADHTERLEWLDHLVQMLDSGEYALPRSDNSRDSPDRTIAVGKMDNLRKIQDLITKDKIDADKATAKSYFDAVADYLREKLPPEEAAGSAHDLIMRATGTDYDPSVYKFNHFKNMLHTRRSSMSQDGTRLSTDFQYVRANIDQIKLQMNGMIDQIYGMMTKLATFG